MINNLDEISRVLQIMWPRLGHKMNRQYKKGIYHYEVSQYYGRNSRIHHGSNKISICNPNTSYELEVFFTLTLGIVRVSAVVLVKDERLKTIFYRDQEVTDAMIWVILREFGKTFLPLEIWGNISYKCEAIDTEYRLDDFDRLVRALAEGLIVSIEENPETGGICLTGIFDNDSDVALHYSADNPEKWNALKDRKIILIKDLHELHL